MRFTADSRFLFVASEQAHVVSVVDMAQLSVIKSVPTGGSRPVDVAFTLDGSRAYVSHGQSGDVRVLDAVHQVRGPTGIAASTRNDTASRTRTSPDWQVPLGDGRA